MTSPAPSAAPLRPGRRLGPYEVLSLLGAGGMGEVYRARDTRLGREVAVKVIAFDTSSDPGRLRRFELEARAVAALNHPNILSVYDVGEEAGAPFVVFELLEGESLRVRLTREAVPPRKAVDWAIQIARGLAAAHERGVVHRDVKPENLFLTKDRGVKVLDFGLAKLVLGEDTVREAGDSSTLSAGTSPGTLLGTAGYMSPEQVRGEPVDARSDIFSLGAVLYEMLSGRRAFRGNSVADTLTAILKEDPPELASDRGPLPPGLERIVRRCIEKAPEERFQSARDLAFDLEALSGPSGPSLRLPAQAQPPQRVRVLTATLIGGVLALAAFIVGRQAGSVVGERAAPTTPRSEVRLQVVPPAGLRRVSGPRLSPDGTRLAFVGRDVDGKVQLWVRPLGSLETRPLPGTEGVQGTPFWSPDSRSIAFFTRDQLKRVEVSGGQDQMLCTSPPFLTLWKGGSWNSQGVVIFTPGTAVYRVPASGGDTVPVTTLDEARREGQHAHPDFLPDGRHFVYFVRSEDPDHRGVRLGSLDSAETKPLLEGEEPATYAWPGYLLMRRGPTLLAHPFDALRLELTGEPFVLAESVATRGFSASQTGVLAFLPNNPSNAQPTWFDRAGKPLGTVGEPGPYIGIALSPDGRQAAVQQLDPRLETYDIWLLDLARGVLSPVTSDPGSESDPVWSPDGRRLAFTAEGEDKGRAAIFLKDLGGGSEERVLPPSTGRVFVEHWSRDGRFLTYHAGFGGRDGIWFVPLLGDRKPTNLVPGPFFTDEARLSPDGRLLAFMSSESGEPEVYVQPFPGPGLRKRVSNGGGGTPRWRGDSRELFYVTNEGTLMALDIPAGATLEPGIPGRLFATHLARVSEQDRFDVTPDGQRFLVLMPPPDAAPLPITVVLNWPAGLKR